MISRSKAIEWCDRVMYCSLLPVAFFLPISTAVVETGAWMSIVAFLVKRFLGSGFNKHFLIPPIAAFLGATVLSVLFSHFPAQSWKAFFGKTLESIILFFAVVECINTRRRLNLFLSVFAFSVMFVSLDAIWQHYRGVDFIFQRVIPDDKRVTGPFHHPNDFASFLIVGGTFFLGLLIWAWMTLKEKTGEREVVMFFIEGWQRLIVFAIGVVMTAVALGWTFSRGAWLGFTVAVGFLTLFDEKKRYVRLAFLIIFWVIFSLQLGTVRNVSFITDDVSLDGRHRQERLETLKQQNIPKNPAELFVEDITVKVSRFGGAGRHHFWNQTLQLAKVSPVVGTGLNTYSDASRRYIPNWTGFYSHNCYLQMLAEIGVLGLSAFLWIMFTLTREAWRSSRQIVSHFDRALLIALFSGIAGFWTHSFFDTNFYSARLGNLMWIFMGLIVVVILLSRQQSASQSES